MSYINSKKSDNRNAPFQNDQIDKMVKAIQSRPYQNPSVKHHNIHIVFPTPPGYTPKGTLSTNTIKSTTNTVNQIPDIKSVNVLRHPSKEFISTSEQKLFNIDLYREYRKIAHDANTNRKIFMVYGAYRTIRNGLLRRGWIEKLAPGTYRNLRAMSQHALLLKAKKGNDYEKVCLSKMIEHFPAYFIWQMKFNRDEYLNAFPYRNRIRRGRDFDFSTKLGFIGCAESIQWCTQDGKSELKCPRFHRLNLEEQANFLEDFRLTECFSLLSYLNDLNEDILIYSNEGIVPSLIIKFAIDRVNDFVKHSKHRDVDEPYYEKSDEQWDHFVTNSRNIIRKNEKFKCDKTDYEAYKPQIRKALEDAEEHWPSLQMDGYNNLWILKPGFSCRGRGIVIMRNYENIVSHANKNPKSKYMVQKYIERPLLVYKTKFDIRQYMLLTITDNINIWMYKDCYLRFSSQEFTLDSFMNSIHLTNNSIQKYCKNGKRSTNLPAHNMWSLSDFRAYLNNIGHGNVWPSIYEGMKKSCVAIVQASLVDTEIYHHSFEIYGCDFMLNENFEPYMIEVNSSPDLSPSTVVTRRICPAALEDLLKVVVDLPRNPKSNTGNFEKIFSTPIANVSSYIPGLLVNGMPMRIHQEILPTKPKLKKRQALLKGKFGKKKRNKKATEQGVLLNTEAAKEKSVEKLNKLVSEFIPNTPTPRSESKSKEFLNSKIKEALALHFTSKSGKESAVLQNNDKIVDEFVNVLQRTSQKGSSEKAN